MKIAAAVLSMFLALPAFGQITLGAREGVRAPMCTDKEAIIAVAKMDSKEGPQAAMALFKQSQSCGIGQAYVVAKSVVITLPTERGATVRVLEIEVDLGEEKVTAYMLVDTEVIGLKAV